MFDVPPFYLDGEVFDRAPRFQLPKVLYGLVFRGGGSAFIALGNMAEINPRLKPAKYRNYGSAKTFRPIVTASTVTFKPCLYRGVAPRPQSAGKSRLGNKIARNPAVSVNCNAVNFGIIYPNPGIRMFIVVDLVKSSASRRKFLTTAIWIL